MAAWKTIVGISFTPDEFDSYCHSLQWSAWRPSFVVLHNTAIPSLAQRPQGFTKAHIQNFVSFYRDVQGWPSGPHLFVDDRQIWVFTPLTAPGTHTPSWNNVSWGVEMLGDYEHEAFSSGRGLLVQQNTVAAVATLSSVLGLDPQTLRLHREDPLTTHATCPGQNVSKPDFIQAVQAELAARHPGEHVIPAGGPTPPNPPSQSGKGGEDPGAVPGGPAPAAGLPGSADAMVQADAPPAAAGAAPVSAPVPDPTALVPPTEPQGSSSL